MVIINNLVIAIGIYLKFDFSELRREKHPLHLTRNQPFQSLDVRSKAEEQWYAHLNLDLQSVSSD